MLKSIIAAAFVALLPVAYVTVHREEPKQAAPLPRIMNICDIPPGFQVSTTLTLVISNADNPDINGPVTMTYDTTIRMWVARVVVLHNAKKLNVCWMLQPIGLTMQWSDPKHINPPTMNFPYSWQVRSTCDGTAMGGGVAYTNDFTPVGASSSATINNFTDCGNVGEQYSFTIR